MKALLSRLFRSFLPYCLLLLMVYFLQQNRYFINQLYPEFYRFFSPYYASILGWLPFSVGDLLYGLFAVFLFWHIIRGIGLCFQTKFKKGFFVYGKLIRILVLVYVVFHFLWGFHYRESPLFTGHRMENSVAKQQRMASYFLAKAKQNRKLCDEDETGVFFIGTSYEQAYPKTIQGDFLPYTHFPFSVKSKPSLYSFFFRYAGISGYFNPFTAETQYIRSEPLTTKVFSVAHEKAHLMGYAPEYEANFVGYLACIQSKNPALRYVGYLKALRYVLSQLYAVEPKFVSKCIKAYSPAMQRDRERERQFYLRYKGKGRQTFSRLNDVYLKANNQKQGVKSYNRFVVLLEHYYTQNAFLLLQSTSN